MHSIPEEVNSMLNQAAVEQRAKARPLIDMFGNTYYHVLDRSTSLGTAVNTKVRIVMTRNLISIGCTDITPYAARKLVKAYLEAFPDVEKEVVIQP